MLDWVENMPLVNKKMERPIFLRKATLLVSIHLFFTLIKTLDVIFEWKGNIRSWPSKQMQTQS